MPHTDVIPTSASTASTGKGIRYIGNWAYAHSGNVTDAGSASAATTLLDFTSGAGLIVAKFNWVTNANSNIDMYLDMLFNNQSVYKGTGDQDPSFIADRAFTMVIPPLTNVVFNMGFNATKNMCIVMAGRVYGAE
jgi:hypothetical protein